MLNAVTGLHSCEVPRATGCFVAGYTAAAAAEGVCFLFHLDMSCRDDAIHVSSCQDFSAFYLFSYQAVLITATATKGQVLWAG